MFGCSMPIWIDLSKRPDAPVADGSPEMNSKGAKTKLIGIVGRVPLPGWGTAASGEYA
jgi:hypothetical protein